MAQANRRLLPAHRFEKSSARISFRCGWIQVLERHQGLLSPCISFTFLCVDCILRWLLLSLCQPGYVPLQDCALSVLRGEKGFPPGGSNLSSSVEGHWITCGQACADWPGLGHMTPAGNQPYSVTGTGVGVLEPHVAFLSGVGGSQPLCFFSSFHRCWPFVPCFPCSFFL